MSVIRCALLALAALTLPPPLPTPAAAAEGDEAAVRCLALTLFWEARSEGRAGMEAVAAVVLNRVRSPEFPDTVCGVVQDGTEEEGACAFTWWCDGEADIPAEYPDWPEERDHWALAEAVAREMLANPDRDVTGGALYYHTEDVQPAWAAERRRVAKIGRHIYYR